MTAAHTITKESYRLSFISGGLFMRECVQAIAFYGSVENWATVRQQLISNEVISFNTLSTANRLSREIVTRLQSLHKNELEFFLNADFEERQALIWVSICRTYTIIPEFVRSVVTERILAHRNDLNSQDFASFLDQRGLEHPEIANLAESTKTKLRTVLYRMMTENGFISQSDGLERAYLPMPVRRLLELRNPSEVSYFPGIEF